MATLTKRRGQGSMAHGRARMSWKNDNGRKRFDLMVAAPDTPKGLDMSYTLSLDFLEVMRLAVYAARHVVRDPALAMRNDQYVSEVEALRMIADLFGARSSNGRPANWTQSDWESAVLRYPEIAIIRREG